ncbi:MAG: FadR/GntR family transcriptional regulator [Acidobacteriaceae bacterium]
MPIANPPAPRYPPVRREKIMDMVVGRIEELVRSGHLKRGDQLPSEPHLAKMLDVSRASLREALKGMIFLGLLKARPGDGTYLQPSLSSMVSHHFQWMLLLQEIKYLELYELRQILEPAAAALASRRATPDDLEQMQAALAGMKASLNDSGEFVRREMEFHSAIMQASKNAAIQATMQMMYGALWEGRHRVLPLVRDLRWHCAKHERIFLLIASQQATAARKAVAEDLKYGEALLRQHLQALEAKEKGARDASPKRKASAPNNNPAKKKTTRRTTTRGEDDNWRQL